MNMFIWAEKIWNMVVIIIIIIILVMVLLITTFKYFSY